MNPLAAATGGGAALAGGLLAKQPSFGFARIIIFIRTKSLVGIIFQRFFILFFFTLGFGFIATGLRINIIIIVEGAVLVRIFMDAARGEQRNR